MRPDAPLGTCTYCGERLPTRLRDAGVRLLVLHQASGDPCRGAGRPSRETLELAGFTGTRRDLDAWAAR